MDRLLEILKVDLGITHTKKDTYFLNLLEARKKELEKKGIVLDINNIEDVMLICDYASFCYKNRDVDIELSKNLKLRILNKVMESRANIEK